MTRVAIIAAMAGELKPLVRGWQHEHRNGVDLWRWRSGECEWIAACAGAGVEAATRAFAETEKDGAIDRAISVGWAGALSGECKPGQAYIVSGVIDVQTGERFPVAARPEEDSYAAKHWLVTSPKVADAIEKQRLAAAYGAGLVDMEAAVVARMAGARNIPFECIKGVSDAFADSLPDFNRFISTRGQFQLARFIAFVLLRPRHWPALMRMGENSKKAAIKLREFLLESLDIPGVIKKKNV
jgi:adenosylhomocysteine nucleosidase